MYENIDHVKNLPYFKKRKILSELENLIELFDTIDQSDIITSEIKNLLKFD